MSRAVSIHIGVDAPRGRMAGRPLQHSERLAWEMARLAEQAGYGSLLVLRGAEATRLALHGALTAAAGSLENGDILFVSFSGHGCLQADVDGDEGHGWDETWCLYDGEIVDDQLAGYWRLFAAGVRILVVADGCHSAGGCRDDDDLEAGYAAPRGPRTMRGETTEAVGSFIVAPPNEPDGIRASLLVLAAAGEDQKAENGLFMRHLVEVWDEGGFRGTFCDLYRQVRERVMSERGLRQEPQILMLGSPDPGFPLERAFHLERRGTREPIVYR